MRDPDETPEEAKVRRAGLVRAILAERARRRQLLAERPAATRRPKRTRGCYNLPSLVNRAEEVLAMTQEGMSRGEIARALGSTENQVKWVRRKFDMPHGRPGPAGDRIERKKEK